MIELCPFKSNPSALFDCHSIKSSVWYFVANIKLTFLAKEMFDLYYFGIYLEVEMNNVDFWRGFILRGSTVIFRYRERILMLAL